MTLPATISTAARWPDEPATFPGPFVNGADLYVFLGDAAAAKLRAYRSTDGGHTWAEQDAANAPAALAAGPQFDADASGATVYLANVLSASSLNVLRFDMATNLWLSAVAGPTIALSVAFDPPSMSYGVFLCRVTNTTDFLVLAYQGATQSVMGTAYNRVKLHQYNVTTATWTGPFDVQGSANSPAANTLPGTQAAYVVQGVVRGSGSRCHVVYGNDFTVQQRTWNAAATGTFGAVTVISGGTDQAWHARGVGRPCAFALPTTTGLAVPYAPYTTSTFKVARCTDSASASLAANWTQELVTNLKARGSETTLYDAVPGFVCADPAGDRVWCWLVESTDAALAYTNDRGAQPGAWTDPTRWKEGADVLVGGAAAAALPDGTAVGVVYHDLMGTPVLEQRQTDAVLPVAASTAAGRHRAQSFQLAGAGTLAWVRLHVREVGSVLVSDQVEIRVCADDAGVPGALLGGSQFYRAADATSTTPGWVYFKPFTPIALSATTTYWLKIASTATISATDHFAVSASTTDVYAGGAGLDGSGAVGSETWTAPSGWSDLAFQLGTSEDSLPRVRYDRLVVFHAQASRSPGSVVSDRDLGDPPPASVLIVIDVGEGADPAGTVEVAIEGSWDQGAWTPLANAGPYASWVEETVNLADPPRYLRATTTTTGAASVSGVAGV